MFQELFPRVNKSWDYVEIVNNFFCFKYKSIHMHMSMTMLGLYMQIGQKNIYITRPITATCPDLVDPDRGNVAIVTTDTSTIATYTCDSPYSLIGASLRTCQANDSWTGSAPYCGMCAISRKCVHANSSALWHTLLSNFNPLPVSETQDPSI